MRQSMTVPDAEALALRALGFLAAEPERLEPFLAATGLGPANLRAAAGEPHFLAAVLDYLSGTESLLLEFSENLSVNPESVTRAQMLLAGPASGEFA